MRCLTIYSNPFFFGKHVAIENFGEKRIIRMLPFYFLKLLAIVFFLIFLENFFQSSNGKLVVWVPVVWDSKGT